jgi:cyclohexa-1,5-dienecarbonyl-CoA hydratase
MGEFIQVGVKDGVASVTLNRPPLNVLNTVMLAELNAALEPLVGDRGIGAIVLRAAGKAFSAGVDIADHTPDKVHGMIGTFHGVFRKLAATDALTIAAVNGAALGGGCELACFCDVVLAADRAKFGQPEVKVGVFPPVAACTLPLRIGTGRAIEFNALGEIIDASEALRIGVADHVYPAAEFESRVDGYTGAITKLSRPVVRLTKRATAWGARGAVLAHLEEAERLYLGELMKLADAHEGLAAFLEKRTPVWRHG